MTDNTSIVVISIMATALVVAMFLDAESAQLAAGLGLSAWVILHFPLYDKIGLRVRTKWARMLSIVCIALTSFFVMGSVAVTLMGFLYDSIPNIVIGMMATVVLVMSLRRQIPELFPRSAIRA